MLWFKKQKVHEPFGNDFNLVTIRLTDPTGPRQTMRYTFPDNWTCQLIGATLYIKSGAFGLVNPWIEVVRRGRMVWILPWSQTAAANTAYDICWGVGLPSSRLTIDTDNATAPLPDYCFIEGGDRLSFEWAIQAIDGIVKTATLYLKQWIIY